MTDTSRGLITKALGSTEGTLYVDSQGNLVDITTDAIISTGNSGLSFGKFQNDVSAQPADNDPNTSSTAINEQVQKASLLTPDEIERHFRREEQSQIVLIKGERPMASLL